MNKFKDNIYIKKILYGLKPVVVGLIFYAALNLLLSMEAVTNVSLNSFIYMMVILLFLVLLMYRKVNPLLLIIVSGVYGVIFNI